MPGVFEEEEDVIVKWFALITPLVSIVWMDVGGIGAMYGLLIAATFECWIERP